MRTRRSYKKTNKTNKAYWITGVTCTILATGVFWATSPLSGDTGHSNQEPDQTQVYQAQKDRQSMIQDKLESINKEYKKKAKTSSEASTEEYTETYTEPYTEATTEAETTQEEQPAHNLPGITDEQIEANKKAFEEEQKAMGKGKTWEELIYEENVDHDLLLLAAMNYDTEFRDFYLKAASGEIEGYVTAQNNTSAVIWNAGCVNSQYKGIPGNETLQDFYMNVEETGNEQGGTITHQGIKVTYKTIWLNPGIPATGSLYQITNVEKVN